MEKELTRYEFMSHMKDFMKHLLCDPLHPKTSDLLNSFGIDGPVAIQMLLKRTDPKDENSAILIRSERIKDNGTDENGKRNKDTFEIKYKIPRKDFKKKLRNLYINLFESNLVDDNPLLNEGAWGYGILDNDMALDYQTKFATVALKVLTAKLMNSHSNDTLWSNIGVMVDFLKKYKDDEVQLTDEYVNAVEITKRYLTDISINSDFASQWSEPEKFKSSVKKILKDISLLKYQKDIMTDEPTPQAQEIPEKSGIMEDDCAGATSCEDSSGQYNAVSFPIVRKKLPTNESKTLYITSEQANYLKEATAGDIGQGKGIVVPFGNKNDDFYKEACDHNVINKFKRV